MGKNRNRGKNKSKQDQVADVKNQEEKLDEVTFNDPVDDLSQIDQSTDTVDHQSEVSSEDNVSYPDKSSSEEAVTGSSEDDNVNISSQDLSADHSDDQTGNQSSETETNEATPTKPTESIVTEKAKSSHKRNRKGLLIGAVVAVAAIGTGVYYSNVEDDQETSSLTADNDQNSSSQNSDSESPSMSAPKDEQEQETNQLNDDELSSSENDLTDTDDDNSATDGESISSDNEDDESNAVDNNDDLDDATDSEEQAENPNELDDESSSDEEQADTSDQDQAQEVEADDEESSSSFDSSSDDSDETTESISDSDELDSTDDQDEGDISEDNNEQEENLSDNGDDSDSSQDITSTEDAEDDDYIANLDEDDSTETESNSQVNLDEIETSISELVEQSSEQNEEKANALKEELDSQASEIKHLREQLQQTQEKMGMSGQITQEDYLLNDITRLVQLAENEININSNRANAINILELAQKTLKRSDNRIFNGLQNAISSDIVTLKTSRTNTSSQLFDQVNKLSQFIDEGQLKTPDQAEHMMADGVSKKDQAANETSQAEQSSEASTDGKWYDKSWGKIKEWSGAAYRSVASDVKHLVRVEKLEDSKMGLLSIDQASLVRHNLSMKLNFAQQALLSQDQNIWKSSLESVAQGIQKYYRSDAEGTQQAMQLVSALWKTSVSEKLPDLTETRDALQETFEQVKQNMSKE